MAQFLQFDTLTQGFLDVLRDRILLPSLVTRSAEAEANAHIGKKVAMRRPRRRVAKRRDIDSTAAITLETSLEDEVSITLVDDVYDARPITDAELTLDIDNFGIQVMNPMVDAIADYLEGNVADLIEGATYLADHQLSYTRVEPGDPSANRAGVQQALLDAWTRLNVAEVPAGDRIVVAGSQFAADYLGGITNISVSSENTSALREAALPSVYGFSGIYNSNAIAADKAYVFHRSAFMVAMRAPVVPQGAVDGRSMAVDGIPLTVFRDYDPTITVDRIVARTFYGDTVNTDHVGTQAAAADLDLKRAVEITVEPYVAP